MDAQITGQKFIAELWKKGKPYLDGPHLEFKTQAEKIEDLVNNRKELIDSEKALIDQKKMEDDKFIQQDFDGKVCIAHCEEQNKTNLKSIINPAERITILIGPEGDFSTEEIQKALANKFIPVSLGESRLRTETAALVVVNIVSFINE